MAEALTDLSSFSLFSRCQILKPVPLTFVTHLVFEWTGPTA